MEASMKARARLIVTTVLDVVGSSLVVVGTALISWQVALVVAGVGVLAVSRRLS